MSRLVILILCVNALVNADTGKGSENAREEKLRSGLIDAFQTIKKASAKGGIDDEGPLTSDLIGSMRSDSRRAPNQGSRADDFDLMEDEEDDGLTFAEAFGDVSEENKLRKTTEKSHNVQHLVKTTNRPEKTTTKPDNILKQINNSIRSAVNETRNNLQLVGIDRYKVNDTNLIGIDDVLKVFDAGLLITDWARLRQLVSGQCRLNLQSYVEGLAARKLWAMKMDDASGRYSGMFYWGNNYWVGSSELCTALNDQRAPNTHNRSTSDGSQIFSAWREDVSLSGIGPPFAVSFYSLRLRLSADDPTIIRTRRTLHLGLCFPRSCDPKAVGKLVDGTAAPLLKHAVLAVRSADHNSYSYIEDTTFRLLIGVCCLVGTLLITATIYEVRLSRAASRRRRRAANIDTATGKLDLNGLEAVAINNGKSVYNVNNNNSEEHLTGETSSTHEEIKLSVWSELLLSFSLKTNVLQIFDQSVGVDTVAVVHGLRSFSMVWVIFGHTCIVVFKYADNTALRAMLEKSFLFQLIISAVYSVDTFFCLGGMLVSFLYFRTNAKGKLDVLTKGRRKITSGILQFLGLIGYRFARLTTPYLFILGVVEVTMKWFAHNAVFEPPANDHETCPQYWWRNVLYINTLFPVDQMCMLWSWYLSDDTQFYAVSAVLLILATSHFKVAASLTSVFFVSSLVTTGYLSWSNEHIPNSEDPFTQFDKIYDKPWTRLGPYLVGMITGWILFKTNLRIKMKRIWAWVGWCLCAGTLLFLIFGLYRTKLDAVSAALYSAFSHSLWAASIGWIIVACSTGYGGWIRPLLASPLLYPFSRVTYCAYLVHPLVLRYVAMHLTHPIHLGELLVFVLFLGLTVISYALAFLISVAFEAPVVTMLKILSPQRKPHRV